MSCLVVIICSYEHEKSQAVQRLDKETLLAYLEVNFYFSLLPIFSERGKRNIEEGSIIFFLDKKMSLSLRINYNKEGTLPSLTENLLQWKL